MASAHPAEDLSLRELVRPEELRACRELQRETWGPEFSELVPYSLLLIARKTGGVLAGAFDREDRMLGFVFGLTGFHEGRPLHWSHMLAVSREARGRGLGVHLKRFQRALLLARGVELAYWSFDPLVAKNAHLNLNRLGVDVVEYVADMYGRSTGSTLHGDSETDRLVVAWRLGSERVRRLLAAQEADEGGSGIGPPASEPPEVPGGAELEGQEAEHALRIEIPWSLEDLLRDERRGLPEWRRRTREAFQSAFARGYSVTGFRRSPPGPDGPGRGFYILSGPASSAAGSHISSNSS